MEESGIGRRTQENFERAYEELDENDKKELTEIRMELGKINEGKDPNSIIEDRDIKRKIAEICIKLIEETPNDKIAIMETAYIITGNFIWFNYGDEDLDSAISLAGDLEIPEKYISGDVMEKWAEMKDKFGKYLSK